MQWHRGACAGYRRTHSRARHARGFACVRAAAAPLPSWWEWVGAVRTHQPGKRTVYTRVVHLGSLPGLESYAPQRHWFPLSLFFRLTPSLHRCTPGVCGTSTRVDGTHARLPEPVDPPAVDSCAPVLFGLSMGQVIVPYACGRLQRPRLRPAPPRRQVGWRDNGAAKS